MVPSEPADPLLGVVLGERYEIVERIGSGGMATVYRAEHRLLKRPVAVKVLLPELALDPAMVARFEREAMAVARVEHANLVAVNDFGRTADGQLYLVMEYLNGTPLSTLVGAGRRVEPARAAELLRQILRGVGHAHQAGIVHRDLKTANVMLVRQGEGEVAKVIDFGIAKILDGTPGGPAVETRAGVVVGTPAYIAPERLLGEREPDPRSDLYGAGVILYELLTGRPPFQESDPYATAKRVVNEPPAPLAMAAPGVAVPPWLEAALFRALEKDPERRFASAEQFLAALDPAAAPSPLPPPEVKTRPLELPAIGPVGAAIDVAVHLPRATTQPPSRWATGLWSALVVATLIAIVAGLAVSLTTRDRAAGPLGLLPMAPTPATPAAPAAPPLPEIDRLIAQAAQGARPEDRHSAIDRLVALGQAERVPWFESLRRDVDELPDCPRRLEALERLGKLNNPLALEVAGRAASRPDNACLRDAAAGLIARYEPPSAPTAAPPTVAPAAPRPAAPARAPAKPAKKPRRGGHF